MSHLPPLDQSSTGRPYAVPDPRQGHAATPALRRAFAVEPRMPAEWDALLRRLG